MHIRAQVDDDDDYDAEGNLTHISQESVMQKTHTNYISFVSDMRVSSIESMFNTLIGTLIVLTVGIQGPPFSQFAVECVLVCG